MIVGMTVYPAEYELRLTLPRGESIELRNIRASDEELMVHFHEMLSPLSVRRRYFNSISLKARVKHERLRRICDPDLASEVVIVAVHPDKSDTEWPHEIVAVGRVEDHEPPRTSSDFALVIADPWQCRGLGRRLLTALIDLAKAKGRSALICEMLPDNAAMRRLCRHLGFHLTDDFDEHVTTASLEF